EVNTLSQAEGNQTWRVQLSARSSGAVQEQTLEVHARLRAEVRVQPAALTVFAEQAVGHELVLTDRRPQPLTVTGVRTSSPHLRGRVSEQGRDAAGHWVRKVSLEVAADYPPGRHDEAVHLLTDDEAYKELKIPVTVVKRSQQRLAVTPGSVNLVAPAGQPIPSRVLLVRDNDNQGVVVERVVADDPGIVCHWAPGPNNLATVKVG